MFRKLSGGSYVRRSSQPLRVSGLTEIVEEKKPEMKRSMIPVARPSSRAASFEDLHRPGSSTSAEDGKNGENSRRQRALSSERDCENRKTGEHSRRQRALSSERDCENRKTGEHSRKQRALSRERDCENRKTGELLRRQRALSSERDCENNNKGVTPASKLRPGCTPGSVMTTVRRTARKDTRVLSDKAFQYNELCKVREYLLSKGFMDTEEVENIGSQMPLRLFVDVMNVLLKQYFPDIEITMSTYLEAIPDYLKKLKYPGKVARSWLLSANTAHSWQHVLGIMSWLVNLLSGSQMQLLPDDDLLSSEDLEKMHNFNSRRFREYIACSAADLVNGEDVDFFGALFYDRITYLKEEVGQWQTTVEKLEQEIHNPEKKTAMALLQQRHNELINLRHNVKMSEENYSRLCCELEEDKKEVEFLRKKLMDLEEQFKGYGHVKEIIEKNGSLEELSEKNTKLKTEIVHAENRKECQSAQMEELKKVMYSTELGLAKSRKVLDKEITDREGLVRELICLHPEAEKLNCPIFYTQKDARQVMNDYKMLLAQTIQDERAKVEEAQKKELESIHIRDTLIEKLQSVETQAEKSRSEMLAMEANLKELKDAAQKETNELNEKETVINVELKELHEKIEMENNTIEEVLEKKRALENEIEQMEEERKETEKMYKETLATMKEKLLAHINRCMDAYEEYLGEFSVGDKSQDMNDDSD